jgi:hypothetical protein
MEKQNNAYFDYLIRQANFATSEVDWHYLVRYSIHFKILSSFHLFGRKFKDEFKIS